MEWMVLVWAAVAVGVVSFIVIAQAMRTRRMRRIVEESDPIEVVPRAAPQAKNTRPRPARTSDNEAPLP